MSVLTLAQLRQLAVDTGFPDPDLAASIAMRESGGNTAATNIVTQPAPGNLPERSFGLWQINTLAHPQYNETQLLDPNYNASAAFAISSSGTNWKAWSTYQPQPPSLSSQTSFPWGVTLAGVAIVGIGAGIAYALQHE